MKLLNFFLALGVGAVAHPSKRAADEGLDKKEKDVSFMALIRATDDSFDFQNWALILTKNWLLSSFNYTQFKTFHMSVEIYIDSLDCNGGEYKIDSIIERESNKNDLTLYPPFELIKLKNSINFGNLQKSIPLAGPNYELKANEVAEVYHLKSTSSDEVAGSYEYFSTFPIKVTTDEKSYRSQLTSCLKSPKFEEGGQLDCDPVILNGTLVGFSLRINCDNQLFMKISSIYDWILNYVPELKEEQKQNPVEETIIDISSIEETVMNKFLKQLFGFHQPKITDQAYFNNITININGIPSC